MTLHKPARQIRSNYRSVTGVYYSSFGPIEFESQLERDTYTLLDFDPSVKALHPQSIRIGNYVPDCEICVHSGNNLLAEIKYEQELNQNWLTLSNKFEKAEVFATHNRQMFGFITDVLVYANRSMIQILKWMKFMSRDNGQNQDAFIQEKIKEIMSGGSRITFIDLVRSIDSEYVKTMRRICQCVISKTVLIASTPTTDPMDCILVAASTQPISATPMIFLPYRAYLERKDREKKYDE